MLLLLEYSLKRKTNINFDFLFDFTLIWSIFVSELVREVDRDDEVESGTIGVSWEGIDEWSDESGLESNIVGDEISPSVVEDTIWRVDSDEISVWGSSFIFIWSDIFICSLNEFSNFTRIDHIE